MPKYHLSHGDHWIKFYCSRKQLNELKNFASLCGVDLYYGHNGKGWQDIPEQVSYYENINNGKYECGIYIEHNTCNPPPHKCNKEFFKLYLKTFFNHTLTLENGNEIHVSEG